MAKSKLKWLITGLSWMGLTLALLPHEVPDADAQTTTINGVCEYSETCESDPAECGVCPAADDHATCPTTLGACGGTTEDCCIESTGFGAGTIIIPMDRCHQFDGSGKLNAPTDNDSFCEY